VLGRNEYPIKCGPGIDIEAERVEGRGGIGIEQRQAQGIVVYYAANSFHPIIFVPTNSGFPLPRFQLVPGIGKLSQGSFQATRE
jgi:hypothetical protein